MKGPPSTIGHVQWIGISQVLRLLLQFSAIIILSRILSASDFGLMTMASVVIMFAELFSGMGITTALIQKDRITNNFKSTIFWSSLTIGVAIGVIVASSSPIVARIFSEPRLVDILIVLALIFPITALGSSHLALLERDLRFQNVAQAEMLAAFLGLFTALGLAWYGAGVFSLVGQALVTSTLMTAQFWFLARWRPAFIWRNQELDGVWRFGSNLVGLNVIEYFARNSDNILIGRFWGPGELGLYNLAYRLTSLPTLTISYAINRVLLPVYSEKVRSGNEVANYFLRIVALVALLVAPMSFGLWAVREPFVAVLLGPQWERSHTVLAWLAPTGLLQALLSTTASIFISAGRTDILLKMAVVNTAILVGAFAIGAQFGIVAVAAAYFFAYFVVFAIVFYVVIDFLNLSIVDFIKSVWAPIICALTMCTIVAFANNKLGLEFSALSRLFVLVPLGAVIYFGLISFTARRLLVELRGIIKFGGRAKS